MPNVQIQSWGDERDSFEGIVPETEDATLDKTILALFEETDPVLKVVTALKTLRNKIRKGKLSAA